MRPNETGQTSESFEYSCLQDKQQARNSIGDRLGVLLLWRRLMLLTRQNKCISQPPSQERGRDYNCFGTRAHAERSVKGSETRLEEK